MRLLLDACYLAALAVGSPYCGYMLLKKKKIRAGMKQKLGLPPARTGEPCAWFHCVSVGEVNLAREMIRRFSQHVPDVPAVVSTTTDTGHTAAQKNFPDLETFYFPFDLSPCVASSIRRIRPRCIVLMELELWPNMILSAHKANVPVVLVNGRITEKTYRKLQRLKFMIKPLLARLSAIAVQDETYARRLIDLGAPPENVEITGNMKYDTVKTKIDTTHPAYRAIQSVGADPMIVGGCTWEGEEAALIRIYDDLRQRHPGLGLTLAPRHAERLGEIEKNLTTFDLDFERLSSLKLKGEIYENSNNLPKVILVDTYGELDAVYAAADLAFVGRSLTQHGGQNILEPAALGKPVIFGPNMQNFKEAAKLLLEANAAIEVQTEADLHRQIERFAHDRRPFTKIATAARDVVERSKGATDKNLELLQRVMQRAL